MVKLITFCVTEKNKKPAVKTPLPPHFREPSKQLELVFDNQNRIYTAGSTAELMIVSPFWPAIVMIRFNIAILLQMLIFCLF